MTAKTGADIKIGVALSSVWGQATECGAGDLWQVEGLPSNKNVTELMANDIGGGVDMVKTVEAGRTNPTVGAVPFKMQYEGPSLDLTALFMGAAGTPATSGDGEKHTITYDADRTDLYATVAWQATSDEAFEMPTGLPTSLTITAGNAPDYLRGSIELLGNNILYSDTTNTTTTLEDCTLEDANLIVIKPEDEFRINAQAGGALATGDKICVTGVTIALQRGQELVPEICGVAGNGEPRAAGEMPFIGDVTVTFKNLADATYFEAQEDGTEYKLQLHIVGPLIAGTTYYGWDFFAPRVKVVASPSYDISSTVQNPYTVVFKCLAATANPTGMDSTLPYFEVVNTKTGDPLAV
jgi:hypothetical protein